MDHLAVLADLQARFLETTRRADPGVRIPWLGRWTVQSLVVHLARIHHWAAGQARRQQESPLGRGPFDLPVLYEACARAARGARRARPRRPRVGPRRRRRAARAADRHRRVLAPAAGARDARAPLGSAHGRRRGPRRRRPRLARLPRRGGDGHASAAGAARPHRPAARARRVRPVGADARLELAGAPADAPMAVVRGSARSLALLAWGRGVPDDDRLAADGVEVEGERALAEATVRAGLTP